MLVPSLRDLSNKYDAIKFYGDHKYGDIYNHYLSEWRESVSAICEIGIDRGNSAKVWLEYFPNAIVYGVDMRKECENAINHPRFVPIIRLQIDRAIWQQDIPDMLDIVIDDGSHVPSDQITAINNGFHKLKSGGMWFIEDCQTSFIPDYTPRGLGIFGFLLDRIVELQMYGFGYGDFYRGRQEVGLYLGELGHQVFSIHVYKSLVMLEKARI